RPKIKLMLRRAGIQPADRGLYQTFNFVHAHECLSLILRLREGAMRNSSSLSREVGGCQGGSGNSKPCVGGANLTSATKFPFSDSIPARSDARRRRWLVARLALPGLCAAAARNSPAGRHAELLRRRRDGASDAAPILVRTSRPWLWQRLAWSPPLRRHSRFGPSI